jgi:hypothetical protein
MSASDDTQDFVAQSPPFGEMSLASSQTPTQQSAATADVVLVRLQGPETWKDTQSPDMVAEIWPYASESGATALCKGKEGISAARTLQDMSWGVRSKVRDIDWSQLECDQMKSGSLKPTDTPSYKTWAEKEISCLQSMAEEHNKETEDGEMQIRVLTGNDTRAQVTKSGFSVVAARHMELNADKSKKSQLERAEEDAELEAYRASQQGAQ